MPRGFAGKSVERFFSRTGDALKRAGDAHSRVPFEGRAEGLVPFPRFATPNNQPIPFAPEDAWSEASHGRGAGDSSNIVVDPDVYNDVMRRVDILDNQAGEDLHMVCTTIEDMCARIFIVPGTVPRILNVSEQLKNSLGQFRALTDDANISMRRYVDDVMDRDRGNTKQLALSKAGAEQAINRVSGTIDRQINSMERTAESYKNRASNMMV